MNESRNRILLPAVLLITLISGGVFFYTLTHALFGAPEEVLMEGTVIESQQAASLPQPTDEPIDIPPAELPSRLIIPKLSVDTDVQHVGLTAAGAMGIPSNFTDVAWYKHGTVPGQLGSAVIDGHVDNGLSLPAVFHDLHTLSAGDSVTVLTEEGTHLEFEVEKVEEYHYESMPLETIFNANDAQRLVLITCSGEWIKDKRTYDKRIAVYAKIKR